MEDNRSFGTILKVRRKALDLTQTQLADLVGCATSTIRMIELGSRRPSRQLAELLAGHLHIEPGLRNEFLRSARQRLSSGTVPVEGEAASLIPLSRDVPMYLTSLIGRQRELAELTERLCSVSSPNQARLFTLSGPAGVGKTRLAAALAFEVQNRFSGGVHFVSLASFIEPVQVLNAIAAAFELHPANASSASLLKLLTRHLQGKQILLILDNLEQVIEAGPDLASLLAACPLTKMLVTSRVALRVRGENIFPVPLLNLPDPEHLPLVEVLSGYSAVALFVERVQEKVAGFTLTAQNAPFISAICARLDGLPLALELVAARVAVFAPQTLLLMLERAGGQETFKLLGEGARDLPSRQQSLYTAIEWSYDLLEPADRQLFIRLAVFVDGVTLSAIEAVCGDPTDANRNMLAGVSSLLEKNLLIRDLTVDDGEESRFMLLQTLRDFALVKFEAQGDDEVKRVRERHAAYFVAFAEESSQGILGKEQLLWIRRVKSDHNNVQAALSWLLAQGKATQAARLAGAMSDFWVGHSHPEALHWFLAVLERRDQIPPGDLTKVLRSATTLAVGAGKLQLAQNLAEENLGFAQQIGDPVEIMKAHLRLGAVANELGNFTLAEISVRESLRLAQDAGDLMTQSAANSSLGEIARTQNNFTRAKGFYEASINLAREAGNVWNVAVNEQNLGRVYLGMGNLAAAASHLRLSLKTFWELDSKGASAYCLSGLGATLLEYNEQEGATLLLGAAETLLEHTGIILERVDLATHNKALKQARIQLGPGAFRAALREGKQMDLDQALEYINRAFAQISQAVFSKNSIESKNNLNAAIQKEF